MLWNWILAWTYAKSRNSIWCFFTCARLRYNSQNAYFLHQYCKEKHRQVISFWIFLKIKCTAFSVVWKLTVSAISSVHNVMNTRFFVFMPFWRFLSTQSQHLFGCWLLWIKLFAWWNAIYLHSPAFFGQDFKTVRKKSLFYRRFKENYRGFLLKKKLRGDIMIMYVKDGKL